MLDPRPSTLSPLADMQAILDALCQGLPHADK
jgi:hypothetical protein